MKLIVYSLQMGVTYKTASRWWKAGRLDAYQLETGTVIVGDPLPKRATGVALYARVSSVDQKNDLERHMQRLKDYAAAIGSGLNDRRPKFLKLSTSPTIGVIVLSHRDRGTRFGFTYLEQLLAMQGRRLEVIFPKNTDDDLVNDFVSVITSAVAVKRWFSARLDCRSIASTSGYCSKNGFLRRA